MTNLFASVAVFASGSAEEMPSVLSVPIDELIIGLVAFFVVFGVLGKLALPAIKKTLEERTNTIEGGIVRAEAAQVQAQQMLEEYKAQLAAAREEASAIRTQAQADRTAIIEEARTEARVAAQAVTAAAEAQLGADRAQATASLTRQVGELAVGLAGKVVGVSLTDDARVSQTVEDFINELDQQVAR